MAHLELSNKWLTLRLMYKSCNWWTENHETGIRLSWWPVKRKLEGESRLKYHWSKVAITSEEEIADRPIRTTP